MPEFDPKETLHQLIELDKAVRKHFGYKGGDFPPLEDMTGVRQWALVNGGGKVLWSEQGDLRTTISGEQEDLYDAEVLDEIVKEGYTLIEMNTQDTTPCLCLFDNAARIELDEELLDYV